MVWACSWVLGRGGNSLKLFERNKEVRLKTQNSYMCETFEQMRCSEISVIIILPHLPPPIFCRLRFNHDDADLIYFGVTIVLLVEEKAVARYCVGDGYAKHSQDFSTTPIFLHRINHVHSVHSLLAFFYFFFLVHLLDAIRKPEDSQQPGDAGFLFLHWRS